MEPRIETLNEKKFIGKKVIMSFSEDKTRELWQSFMPRRKEINNSIGNDLYCLQVYGNDFDFNKFDLNKKFEKWAAVEVTDFDNVPDEMETITIISGLYAVFIHKGAASTGPGTYRYIFGTWLPNSGYDLDNRPHFDILGDKYKNDDPTSEEEIWVPIKVKV
ncbi:GyrI-like domain-containing protein [Desulfosporosinus sp. PR]|uniref:GyrI-like domain-containing protein n=1 Tax=Candidatus Desulfosporosinus nitrosoreducens TaxID=3401928 RepID=UPI0027F877AC|nr:GyrI-like domain-containing protein [Desulfosporosinus sp. PR]MDQ7096560.1 GyrI-like domain-containing protein [Desulfosporosinus sp. PR]